MIATHTEMLHATCPVDPAATDYYEVTVMTRDLLPVERFRAALAACRGRTDFQEEITQWLANNLGASVTTTGLHGTTRSRVTCEPVSP